MEHSTGTTFGSRVRYYRSKAGLSQLNLEIAVGAAPGSISRIENEKVNPTKETLLRIAGTLELYPKEIPDLLGLRPLFPTQADNEAAITEAGDYLNNQNKYGYLIDDWLRLVEPTKAMVKLIGLSEDEVARTRGKNLLEIFFNPELKVRQVIDPSHFDQTMLNEILRVSTELEGGLARSPFFKKLLELPEFERLYKAAIQLSPQDILAAESKVAFMVVGGQQMKFIYVREKLKRNDRFEITDFLPVD